MMELQLSLEVGDGHADGRRHARQRARRSRERAVIEHGKEYVNVVGGKSHGLIYQKN